MKETIGGVTDLFKGCDVVFLARHNFSQDICKLKVETNYLVVGSHKRQQGSTSPLR